MAYDELGTFAVRTDFRPHKCEVCERFYNSRDIAAVIDDGHIGIGRCCENCAREHSGPGAFEGNGDSEGIGTALVLQAWDLAGSADDSMSNDGWGYMARFGRYLYSQDDRGFVSFTECRNAEEADKQFTDMYCEGWGAEEDDAYISHDWRDGWQVSFAGKALAVEPRQAREWDEDEGRIVVVGERAEDAIDLRRCIAAVAVEMRKQGYYPNVWEQGERGDLRLIRNVP